MTSRDGKEEHEPWNTPTHPYPVVSGRRAVSINPWGVIVMIIGLLGLVFSDATAKFLFDVLGYSQRMWEDMGEVASWGIAGIGLVATVVGLFLAFLPPKER